MATNTYRYTGKTEMLFPTLGWLAEPGDELEVDADLDVSHIDLEVKDGTSWKPTYVEDASVAETPQKARRPRKATAKRQGKVATVAPTDTREGAVQIPAGETPAAETEGGN